MAHAFVFNTLQYSRKLRAAGLTEAQADLQAEALQEIFSEQTEDLATKADIKDVKNEIKELRTEFKSDVKAMELRLIIKFGSLLAISIGILSVIIKL